MVVRLWREGYPNTLLVGMKIVTMIMEDSMVTLQKTKNGATI